MHWGYLDGWGWGSWLVMTVMMLIFFGGLAAVVVALTRRSAGPDPDPYRPEQILAERFARGEIDEDEFQRRQRALRS